VTASGRLRTVPGLLAAVALAAAATACGTYAPILGAPILAILAGVALRAAFTPPATLRPGLAFAGRNVLQAAIVLSGFGLSLVPLVQTGVATLPVMLGTIAVALLVAPPAGRLLHVEGAPRTLISIGTAICGASAIAAAASVIEPAESEIALSVAVVFFYNVAAVLTFPAIGVALGLSQHAFGIWAGTAINDTSSVVAAAYAYGLPAGHEATIVKLTRATLIVPIVGALAFARARRARSERTRVDWMKIVPWFIVWFVGAAAINSTGVVPDAWHAPIATATIFLICVALAAIGLQTDARTLARTGLRPLALGLILWLCVALSSLLIAHATGS
jgi:uncharacterized integral membrane protein (TIGR00698 family)